jgi:Ca2+-dependent lipid-binding protein
MGVPHVSAGCIPVLERGVNLLNLPLISQWIRIHKAVGLSKQDKRGSAHGGSDPYITLTFSKYGKPMYCTRVITDDLNPVWEETTALLVTPELIKADENLSVELWDSDRHSADDIVGKVELSMQKMIQHPGKMYPQVSKLQGMNEGSEMPGELHWEVGYFGKVGVHLTTNPSIPICLPMTVSQAQS